MKKPRRPFQSKAFYLRLANAAREATEIPITHQDLLETDSVKRSAALKLAADKLRGTVFERAREVDTAEQYLLARLYLQMFRRMVAARNSKQSETISASFEGLAHEIVVTPTGKVKMVHSSIFYARYWEFLRDLERFNVDRLKQCPQCGTIFEGSRNSIYCGDSCGQKHWQQQNPDDHRFIEQKRQAKRKEARKAEKDRREMMDATRPVNIVGTPSKRPARLPIAARRKEPS